MENRHKQEMERSSMPKALVGLLLVCAGAVVSPALGLYFNYFVTEGEAHARAEQARQDGAVDAYAAWCQERSATIEEPSIEAVIYADQSTQLTAAVKIGLIDDSWPDSRSIAAECVTRLRAERSAALARDIPLPVSMRRLTNRRPQ